MSSRRPAEPHYSGRSTGMPRSPAERLEPTRHLSRARRPRQRFVREPGRSSGALRVLSGIFTLALLCMALVGAGALALQSWISSPGPLTAGKVVVIPRGAGAHDIAERLEREGVVSDRRLFMLGYFMARWTAWGGDARPVQLRAGDYQIPRAASVRNVIDIISQGRTIRYRVTIPEGLTSYQIVERLKADENLTGEITEVPPEGTLLPETFIIDRGEARQTILDRMRAESRKLMEKLWAQRQKGLPIKSWDEAVVLASIVEKETGRNDERERVAAVFVNRLRQNMRLQSDPTILYGISTGKTVWNRPIMKSEIAQKTAHNTYQIDGLPPTPICNPGRAAIEAVLNPANTKDLFFVADGNGGHLFSEKLKDHNANVQKWRALERENREKDDKDKDGKDKDGNDSKDKASKDKDGKSRSAVPAPASSAKPAKSPQKIKGAAAAKTAGRPSAEGPWTSTAEPARADGKR
ncbi:MAG TPA: endolytic transglycosylase MltG [Hyphomicrobiaceae bacterium]|nr:endolytic transglycosylase MltG [Hyphomicrobiaceae bacterium]